MKKLLYITAFPPNNKSGGQFFSMNTLKDLSKSFDIDLFYFSYPNHECSVKDIVKSSTELYSSLKNCLQKPFMYPLFTKRFSPTILKQLQNIAAKYDVLYFDYTQVALYSTYINHPCKIIRCHDIMAQKFLRQNPVLLPFIKSTEKKILSSAKYVFVPSSKDSEIVKKVYNIDTYNTHEYLSDFDFPLKISSEKEFVFFGLWSRKENLNGLIWFIKNVLPLLNTDIKLSVMGGGLSLKDKEKYLVPNKIEYLGFVKDCYSTIVNNSAVLVPLFEGAGVKVKVLDSFTAGTPVIGTDVAFEGIPEIKNLTYLVNGATEFATAINNFVPLTVKDKKNLALEFRKNYDNLHLADVLNSLVKN